MDPHFTRALKQSRVEGNAGPSAVDSLLQFWTPVKASRPGGDMEACVSSPGSHTFVFLSEDGDSSMCRCVCFLCVSGSGCGISTQSLRRILFLLKARGLWGQSKDTFCNNRIIICCYRSWPDSEKVTWTKYKIWKDIFFSFWIRWRHIRLLAEPEGNTGCYCYSCC